MQLNAVTRKSAFLAILLLVMMLVAVAVRYIVAPFDVELANSEYRERVISIVMAMLLTLCCGMVEGKMLPRSGLSSSYCTLPIPLYGLLSCGVVVASDTLATAAASLCFAVALYLLIRSLHYAGEKDSVFFASVLLGTMVLLSPTTVVLLAIIPMAVFVLALSLRQTLLMIIGYLLPLFVASYVVWYGGSDFWTFGQSLIYALTTPQMAEIESFPYLSLVMLAVVVAILIWGAVYAFIRPDKIFLLARVRHSFYFFVWVTLLSLSMLFIPACDLSIFAIVAVPLAILLSVALNLLSNNHSTMAYWLLLLLFIVHLFVA